MTTNALTNVDGKWIGDGGGGEIQQEGPSLTLTAAKQGAPLNVRYDDVTTTDDWCFEVVLVRVPKNSNVSVGIVNKDEMGPGWKTRGMFYNGNLTNGSGALITSFGPHLKEGDTVGVTVTNHNKEVTFFYDGRCLGTGFSLEESKTYCPCVCVSGTAQIYFSIPATLPSEKDREREAQGIVGDWKLTEAVSESGSPVQVPQGRDLIMTMHTGPNEKEYDLSMRVGNILRTHVTLEGGGTVKVGMVMSTMMSPPPELREIESFISSSLPKVQSMKHDNETLVLSGGELKMVFGRYHKAFQPLKSYGH
jgi:hypothetical protein